MGVDKQVASGNNILRSDRYLCYFALVAAFMSLFRQYAAPVILAVFGTVSVLGTGLHLLPGCGHFHGWSGSAHTHAHECVGCHHDCDSERVESATEPGISSSDDDCAICRVLAIPRELPATLKVVERETRCEFVVAPTTPQPDIRAERPYAARAPPQWPSSNA